MMPLHEQTKRALSLQRKRCEVYHLWDSKFRCVVAGALSISDFEEIIRTVIVKEFQAVSRDLRALHHEIHSALDVAAGQPIPRGCGEQQQQYGAEVLLRWIDDLQSLEREHYDTSIEYLRSIALHAAPNILREVPAAVAVRVASTAAVATAAAVVAEGGAAPEGEEAPPPPPPVYSVHDAGCCALQHLFPPATLTDLFFVDCRAELDDLGGPGDGETDSNEKDDTNTNTTNRSSGNGLGGGGSTGGLREVRALVAAPSAALLGTDKEGEGEACVLGLYCPATVSLACCGWSQEVLKLRTAREAQERAASALVEELQCELSDYAYCNDAGEVEG